MRENTTKVKSLPSALILVLCVLVPFTTGCQVVEGIFKAGVWVGVLSVFAVVALLVWGIKSLFFRG
jgi:hypothetical protein